MSYTNQLSLIHLDEIDYHLHSNHYISNLNSPNDICRELGIAIDPKGDKRYVQVNLAELGKEPEPSQNKNTNVVKEEEDGKGDTVV